MVSILLNKTKCNRDMLCIIECPMQILRKGVHGYPVMDERSKDSCIDCGHCVAVCSRDAISLNSNTSIDYEKSLSKLIPSKESIEYLIKSRRSVRHYRKNPVEDETIKYLLDIARWAPTASNRQPVNLIVISSHKVLYRLRELVVEWMKESGAVPGLLKVCEDGYDCIFRNAPNLLIAYASEKNLNPTIDCSIATATVELAASGIGLGGCWAGIFMMAANMYTPILEYLEIPEKYRVYTALMLGYPKLKYSRIPERNGCNVRWLKS